MDILSLAPGAFLAGILMFLAPCTLPIIPGYLVFIAAMPATALPRGSDTSTQENIFASMSNKKRRRRILLNAIAFVLGFSVIFIILGTFAAAIGSHLGIGREFIARGAGFIIILFGLMMLNLIRLPYVGGEWHAKIPKFLSVGRWESSLLIGALFALGWSPCIGPILGTVLLFASTSATALQGALLLAVFSLGLGLPFILTALLIDTAAVQFSKWGRAITLLSSLGGILLVGLGFLILFGMMGVVVAWSYQIFEYLGYNRLFNYL